MFEIDLRCGTPIYEQLYKSVVEAITDGTLAEGDKLPSVREMSRNLGVNPNTVARAFSQLENDGIIYSVPGKGSFVSSDNSGIIKNSAIAEFGHAVETAIKSGLTETEMTEIIKKKGSVSG